MCKLFVLSILLCFYLDKAANFPEIVQYFMGQDKTT